MRDPVIARLQRLASGEGTAEDRGWLAGVVNRMAGGASWAAAIAAEQRNERDQLLRQLRIEHYGSLRDRPAAEAIATDLARYEAGAWRRDRFATTCPYRHATHKSGLWAVLSTGQKSLHKTQVIEIACANVRFAPVETGQNPGDDAAVVEYVEGAVG
jgi:hypothetical protein